MSFAVGVVYRHRRSGDLWLAVDRLVLAALRDGREERRVLTARGALLSHPRAAWTPCLDLSVLDLLDAWGATAAALDALTRRELKGYDQDHRPDSRATHLTFRPASAT